MGKSLVLYASFTGTTRGLAEKIGKLTESEVVEIRAKESYLAEDLDWTNTEARCSREHENPEMRPEIKNLAEILEKVSMAETIYVGFPIWWEMAPNMIRTLLDKMDLGGTDAADAGSVGRKVRIFATSGGSGISGVLEELKKAYPFIMDGFQTGGEIDEAKLATWLGEDE